MDKYRETFETWDKLAELYQAKFMDLTLYDESYDFFCQSIGKNSAQILEIGCGPGNITRYLLSVRPEYNIFGIDVAPNMIALAKKNNPAARFATMDCRNIAELKSTYDGIVCGFCLPYLSPLDAEKFISDCYNLLHENGILYLSFVEGEPCNSGFQIGSTGDKSYFYFYNIDDLSAVLQKNKFEIIKVFVVQYTKENNSTEEHTIVICQKR
jgi:SAM-dependent methyltransferase